MLHRWIRCRAPARNPSHVDVFTSRYELQDYNGRPDRPDWCFNVHETYIPIPELQWAQARTAPAGRRRSEKMMLGRRRKKGVSFMVHSTKQRRYPDDFVLISHCLLESLWRLLCEDLALYGSVEQKKSACGCILGDCSSLIS